MKFLKNYWMVVAFFLSFILDSQYQVLEHFIKDPFWLNIAKGFGAVCLAYFTGSKLKSFKEDDDIGGGGIKNPTKP